MTGLAPAKLNDYQVPDPDAAEYLSKIFRIQKRYVKVAMYQTFFYAERLILRNNAKPRVIFIPRSGLKFVQRLIDEKLRRILKGINHKGMFGIVEDTSWIQHAQYHCDAMYVFQMDLHDAFPSVKKNKLRTLLRSLLMENRDSLVKRYESYYRRFGNGRKTKIVKEWTDKDKKELVDKLTNIIIELCTRRDLLPQGTPTAPFLFHLFIAITLFPKLDKICEALPETYRVKFSMYVDNIVISSAKPLPKETIADIRTAIAKAGFTVNERKTRQTSIKNTCPLITGLRINNKKAVLSRRRIRFLRGFFNRAINDKEMWQQAFGYHIMVKQIYKYPGPKLPHQLADVIDRFEQSVSQQRWSDLMLEGKGYWARRIPIVKDRYALED